MQERTDITQKIRNDHLLNSAYQQGRNMGFDELEILKRFTLLLLDLKDEAFQEKLDAASRAPSPLLIPDQSSLSVYGYCPICGSKGILRERRMDGDDKCANGHKYPSKDATK